LEINKGEIMMIRYANHEMKNMWTKGFGVSTPAPMTIDIEPGEFHEILINAGEKPVYDNEGKLLGIDPYKMDTTKGNYYPGIELELEADHEYDVHYHFYLVDQPSVSGELIHVARIVFNPDNLPTYQGQDSLCHMMIEVVLPPNCTNLEDAKITIQNITQNTNLGSGIR
jgi:hypothetical protein